MPTPCNCSHLDAWDQHAVVLALDGPRPILVSPDEQDWHLNAAIVLSRGLPALRIAEQTKEAAIMPRALRLRRSCHPTRAQRTRNESKFHRAQFGCIVTNRHHRCAIALAEAALFEGGSHVVLKYVLRGDQRRK